jgi:hypothetical protein
MRAGYVGDLRVGGVLGLNEEWLICNNQLRFRDSIRTTVANVPNIKHPDHLPALHHKLILACSLM